MKTLPSKQLTASGLTICILIIMLLVTTTVYAASQNYHGLTTVYYTNKVTDQGAVIWNGSYKDYTSPSRSMDQFGLNVWTTYCSCNGIIKWDTYVRYEVQNNPWMMQYNKTAIADGMAKTKAYCPGQTLRGHNYIKHWWQDSGYDGAGGTIDKNEILYNPS
jgi:hypothetical protein